MRKVAKAAGDLRFSIRGRLLALLIVPLALVVALVIADTSLQDAAEQAGRVIQLDDDTLLSSQGLLIVLADAGVAARRFVVSGDVVSGYEAERELAGNPARIVTLRAVARNPVQQPLVAAIVEQSSLVVAMTRRSIALAKSGFRAEAVAVLDRNDRSALNTLRHSTLAFAALQKSLDDAEEAALARSWDRIDVLMILGSILICTLTVGTFLAFRTIAGRLKRLSSNVARFATGERIEPAMGGRDEISDLDTTFHEMMVALNERKESLVQSNEALTRENSERKHAEARLKHVAFHDVLTGLPNRALFMDRLHQMLARQQRHPEHFSAVYFLDLDRFKVVNDSLGHVVGDLLLIAVARRLEKCLRPADTLARLGGDEFTILVEEVADAPDALTVAERILRELEAPFTIAGHELTVMSSIGVAVAQSNYSRPEDVLRDADIAMYRAKALGKNRYQVFAPAMLAHAESQLQLETGLRHALERSEFRLHYQPIVSLQNSELVGFEALIRWQHADRGLVGPDEFIPIAEDSGEIVAIGAWVLKEACRQLRTWNAARPRKTPLTMSVNVSAKQLLQTGFASEVRSVLASEELDGTMLHVEITEGVLVSCTGVVKANLEELRAMGVRIHLDDFGTGYSALGYLHTFPTDALKIDRSFISSLGDGVAQPEIVQSIIALAQSLSIDVIAEGIETGEQLAELRALDCSGAQGYFFSRPLDAANATFLVEAEGSGAPSDALINRIKPHFLSRRMPPDARGFKVVA